MPRRTVNGLAGSPAHKRTRFERDDDHIETAGASSALRNESRKRVRLSTPEYVKPEPSRSSRRVPEPSEDDEEEDGEEDDIDMEESHIDGEGEPVAGTQYEMLRDKEFAHLQHEKEDDQRATQRLRSRPNIVGQNHTAENGILLRVECVNFMCHERLNVELGPLMNFIVGENGSGKSAILTAITVCLGGKASSTNRAGSLKALVKSGQQQAILSVTIKNEGLDAFQHDIYGDSITVERHFSTTGSSGFKVKSKSGRIIGTKKALVEEIVEYFCLQVDNPLNVLSQDQARSFLNSASDSEKYQFFIMGVQLEQLDNDYRLVNEFVESARSKIPEQEERLVLTKKRYEEAQKLHESMKQNEELRRKRRLYMQQVAWAQVQDQEKILEARHDKVRDVNDQIRAQELEIERKSAAFDAADRAYERAVAEAERMAEEEPEAAAMTDAAQEKFDAARRELERIRQDERDAHTQLKHHDKALKANAASIEQEKKIVAGSTGEEVTRNRDRLAAEKDRLEQIREQLNENAARGPGLEQLRDEAKNEQVRMHRAAEAKQQEVRAQEGRIRDLERNDRSPLDGYEPRVVDLLRQIANDTGYREKPIGPMGSLIRLHKPEWSSLLEKTLGQQLNAFVVTSKADQQRLQATMRRLGVQRCPIAIGNRTPLNTVDKEPDAEFDTILRVLKFDDDLIRNQLIIAGSIEQVILIPDRKAAEKVMFDGPPPRNVKACLSFNERTKSKGYRLTARQGGQNLSTSQVNPNPGSKPRMKADAHAQIAQEREYLAQLKDDYARLCQKRDEQRRKVQQCEQELQQQRQTKAELHREERQCEASILGIERDLDQFEGYDARLQGLEEARARLQEEFETVGRQYGELRAIMDEQNKKVQALHAELAQEKAKRDQFMARRGRAADKIKGYADGRAMELSQKNAAMEEMEKLKDDLRRAERKVGEQETTVQEFTTEASKIFPERVFVPEGETHQAVQKKLDVVRKQLEDRNKRIGKTEAQVEAEAATAKKEFEHASKSLKGSLQVIKQLKQTMALRLEKWRLFQRYISASARTNFIYLLSERGYRGRLLLDHVNRKLQIQVEPDATKKNGQGRNTKTLSGGEKSFSSICLLLAIWDSMGSPLRCLDEFDVFMDNVNRAISTNMLTAQVYLTNVTGSKKVSAARRSVSRQYIMITPNAIEGRAKVDKDVKIHRMTDPRQRTLAGPQAR
ncbi:uncharacterized protein PgNI_00441 [Pyricularia grisea]|uniref:RecF/RecN/SMC N-terminal domain-containing protein n=1 Tax=Pyricularia grisea TaxID=148305 RepID=A0A6P8BGP5_PYRGI|nr:uncharacterized protein PgNI_00441 [Pyricularia grisea]TLD15784.1 hypothetical protein PgNI_00441 [Pyricularia grisea]